jgi:hypothetical protein
MPELGGLGIACSTLAQSARPRATGLEVFPVSQGCVLVQQDVPRFLTQLDLLAAENALLTLLPQSDSPKASTKITAKIAPSSACSDLPGCQNLQIVTLPSTARIIEPL